MADILMVIKNLYSTHSRFLRLGSLPLTAAPADNNRNFRQRSIIVFSGSEKRTRWSPTCPCSRAVTPVNFWLWLTKDSSICITCIPSTARPAPLRSLFSHLTSILSSRIHFLWNSISLCLSDAAGLSVPCSSSLGLDVIKVTTYWICLLWDTFMEPHTGQ